MPPVRPSSVETPHGRVSLVAQGEGRRAIVFLHGNSFCKDVFRHQFNAGLDRYGTLVAMDLPGHGTSEDAPDPAAAYSLSGYAESVRAVLAELETRGMVEVVLVGWSLGAHLALALLGEAMAMGDMTTFAGVFIQGAQPVGVGKGAVGGGASTQDSAESSTESSAEFSTGASAGASAPYPNLPLAFQQSMSDDEVAVFARLALGEAPGPAPFMLEAVRRTDGRARTLLGASIEAGQGVDGRRVAETSPVPLAVLHGMDDPFVSAAYLDGIDFANLWEGRVHVLDGVGHAPFWEVPQIYNALLGRFLDSLRD